MIKKHRSFPSINEPLPFFFDPKTKRGIAPVLFGVIIALSSIWLAFDEEGKIALSTTTAVVCLTFLTSVLHYAHRRDLIMPVLGAVVLCNNLRSDDFLNMFCMDWESYGLVIAIMFVVTFYTRLRSSSYSLRAKSKRVFRDTLMIIFMTLLVFGGLVLIASFFAPKKHAFWVKAMELTSVLDWISTVKEGAVDMLFTVILFCLLYVHHMDRKKPYTLFTLAILVPQVAISIVLLCSEKHQPCGLGRNPRAVHSLNVISCSSFVCGIVLDLLVANDETTDRLTRLRREGERRLSVELDHQSALIKQAYASGSALLMEKYDFMQRLVQKINLSVSEVMVSVRRLLELQLSEWQAQCVTEIQRAADCLTMLLTDIKFLLAVESGNIGLEDAAFNLLDVLEDLLARVAKSMTHSDLELVYVIDDNVPLFLSGDSNCLLQILLQLLDNAVKFTSKGEVGVHVSALEVRDGIAELQFTVFDTGVGMTDEELEQCNMFQPFPSFGKDSKRRGSGLGLVVCDKLVKLLGGSLRARPGNSQTGTAFVASLSYELDQKLQTQPPDLSDLGLSGQLEMGISLNRNSFEGLHVLVIDDNTSARDLISRLLRGFGCRVGTASGGVQGMRELKLGEQSKDPYKLAFIDSRMPGMDGVETARMLKEDSAFASLKIVMLLSPLEDMTHSFFTTSFRKYANEYVTKPIKRIQLVYAIASALGLHPNRMAEEDESVRDPDECGMDNASNGIKRVLRVLVADDTKEEQQQIVDNVQRLGHVCTAVSDGVAVVAYVKKNRYDLVLMDLYMPVLDGFGATQLIRSKELQAHRSPQPYHARSVPRSPSSSRLHGSPTPATGPRLHIVGLSSSPTSEERDKCIAAGMDEYFTKAELPDSLRALFASFEQKGSFQAIKDSHKPPATDSGDASRKMSGSTSCSEARGARRIEELENVISRFIPREFQDLIAPQGMENAVLGDAICRTITTFFSDIRDFTAMTEKMHVHQVIDFLNTYVAFAIPAITEKGGFIDKFIGDSIMAIFPQSDAKEQALAAVSAAVGMMKSLDFMRESGFEAVETGIGINTGKTIIGIVGTETRMEPTALGDAVNVASRTETLCKKYGTRILITGNTRIAMGDTADEMFTIRLIDKVTVRGKSQSCDIYEIIDGDRDEIKVLKKRLLPLYAKGIEYYLQSNFSAALHHFMQCGEILPTDKPTLLYIERCTARITALDSVGCITARLEADSVEEMIPNVSRL